MEFPDATLLLVAHGSTVNADSATAAYQHAEALRERGVFKDVKVGFWKQEPFIRPVAASITTPRVFVAPLFLSDGYFTEEVIPRELELRIEAQVGFEPIQRRDGRVWLYCAPFGTHPRVTELVLARAAEVVGLSGSVPNPTETALCLAAHGTLKNDRSRNAVEWQAQQIRGRGQYPEVHALFMEEEPRISDLFRLVNATNVVVVPFFISDGLHAREDVPVLMGEDPAAVQQRLRAGEPTWVNPTERASKRIWYSKSIGTAPLVVELILERVRERVASFEH
jgi:sirohydrochlorin cobaltochelatase